MKHYAIVLGVSEYSCATNLPPCANDAKLMTEFLRATGKYELLELPGNVTKHQAIEKVESFLPINDVNENAGEILFYFSGHGHQNDNDMHFVLSETTMQQLNSTALKNSEIDDVVRRVKPRLFVKIIDACQSGLEYIKGFDDNFSEGLNRSAKGFEKCIFLSSSKKSQSSYVGNTYSLFTKAIIDSVANSTPTIVKFIDIQNYLADVFQQGENGQTPFFSTQCDGTEVFCDKNETLKAFLRSLEQEEQTQPTSEGEGKIAKVQAYLRQCREEAEVQGIMEQVRCIMEKQALHTEWLEEFYDFSFEKVAAHDRTSFYENPSIAKTLSARIDSENLFVKVEYETYRNDGYLGDILAPYKKQPVKFHPLASSLPCVLTYSLRGKNPNLPDYDIPFIFIYSPSFFYVFTSVKQYIRKGWKEYNEKQSTKYTYRQFPYQGFSEEEWESRLEKWLKEAEAYVEKTLLESI